MPDDAGQPERGERSRARACAGERDEVAALRAALAESETRFRTLSDSMPVLVWMSDERGRREHVNKHWLEFTGRDASDELGDGWTDGLLPSDVERWRRCFAAAAAAREAFRIDYRLRDARGELRWIHEHAVPRALFGPFTGFVASCVDVTEHKRTLVTLEEARAQLALVVAHLPVVIYTCDCHDFHTTYVSPNVADITGFGPEDLYADPRLWLERLHPDDRASALTSCAEMESLPFRESEYRWRRADGSWIWFLDVVRCVRGDDGAPRHLAGVLLDITARRLVEDELRATREQARELAARLLSAREDEQRRLSRELHDELGQTLTSVRLDLEGVLRRMQGADAETVRRLARALDGVDAATRGVQEIAQGLRPPVLDDLGLSAGLQALVDGFRQRSPLVIGLDVDCELRGLDDARATCIFRIAQEALTNVVRHARATRARVHLRIVEGRLALTVDDDGRGIADAAASDPAALGLAGLRERARLLGGMALVARRPEGGTRVDVRIPRA